MAVVQNPVLKAYPFVVRLRASYARRLRQLTRCDKYQQQKGVVFCRRRRMTLRVCIPPPSLTRTLRGALRLPYAVPVLSCEMRFRTFCRKLVTLRACYARGLRALTRCDKYQSTFDHDFKQQSASHLLLTGF